MTEMTPTQQDRDTGMAMHLATFGGLLIPFGNIFIPLIIWLIYRDRSQFLDYHGRQALNFQISLIIYSTVITGVIATIMIIALAGGMAGVATTDPDLSTVMMSLSGVTLAIVIALGLLLLVLAVLDLVCTIQAAVKANRGLTYRYPLTIKFLSISGISGGERSRKRGSIE